MYESLGIAFSLYRTYLLRSLILERLAIGSCTQQEMAQAMMKGTREWTDVAFSTTLTHVSKELDMLEKLGFLTFDGTLFALTEHGENANRTALFHGLTATTFLSYRSLGVSIAALVVSVVALIVSFLSIFF